MNQYKVLVSGSRNIPVTEINIQYLKLDLLMLANMSGIGGIDNLFVISGGANGADSIARLASLELGCGFKEVKANWSKYGKSAGHIRNSEMLDMNPDIVWAFPLGASPGTRNCIMQAKQRGIRVDEYHNYFEV